MLKKILFAVDNSEHSKKTALYVKDLAEKYNAEVVVVHTYYLPERFNTHESEHYIYLEKVEKNMQEHGTSILENIKTELAGINVKTILKKGPAGPIIIEQAKEENCDIIAVGSRGLGNVSSVLISSVSNYVVHHATCPVLLIH
jgi:nucleotide-binding universal stress UspA family protein